MFENTKTGQKFPKRALGRVFGRWSAQTVMFGPESGRSGAQTGAQALTLGALGA